MSVSTVVDDIHLVGEQVFDHTSVIQKEIEKFLNNFEKNDRHKEFDGIIRASHSVCSSYRIIFCMRFFYLSMEIDFKNFLLRSY